MFYEGGIIDVAMIVKGVGTAAITPDMRVYATKWLLQFYQILLSIGLR